MGTEFLSLGIQLLGHDVDNLLPSSAEAKNEWSYTSTVLTYLYGVGKYNFTFYEMDGPGIKSRWGEVIRTSPHRPRGPTQPPMQWVPGLSRGKATGKWR
jgi:hypothetical protein